MSVVFRGLVLRLSSHARRRPARGHDSGGISAASAREGRRFTRGLTVTSGSSSFASSPAHHVLQILLILVAHIFKELCVRNQVSVPLEAPWPGVDPRVVYRELDLQMAKVPAPEAFNNVEGVAVRAAAGKNRVGIIEACRIDYQRV